MKNKKGFTLIELLVTLSILAVVTFIAVPTVFNLVKDAKKTAFDTEVRNIMINVRDRFATDNIKVDENQRSAFNYNYKRNPLSLKGEDLKYDIQTDNHGNITCIEISNSDFQFSYKGNGIKNGDKLNILELVKDFEPKCK